MTDPAGNASVTINFECASMDEAKATIDTWVLSPDCRVMVSWHQSLNPGMTDEGGNVVPIPPPVFEDPVIDNELPGDQPGMDNTLPGDLPPE